MSKKDREKRRNGCFPRFFVVYGVFIGWLTDSTQWQNTGFSVRFDHLMQNEMQDGIVTLL